MAIRTDLACYCHRNKASEAIEDTTRRVESLSVWSSDHLETGTLIQGLAASTIFLSRSRARSHQFSNAGGVM